MPPQLVCGIIIIIMILIVGMVYYQQQKQVANNHRFLNGYWEAPAYFCKKAGIKNAQVWITCNPRPDSDSESLVKKDVKRIYFYMEDHQKILLNKCVDITIKHNITDPTNDFTISVSDDIDPLPKSMSARVDITSGMLGMYVGDTMYLELFKNNMVTNSLV